MEIEVYSSRLDSDEGKEARVVAKNKEIAATVSELFKRAEEQDIVKAVDLYENDFGETVLFLRVGTVNWHYVIEDDGTYHPLSFSFEIKGDSK